MIKRTDVENLLEKEGRGKRKPPFESRSSNGRKTVGSGWGFVVFGSISFLASSIGEEWTISRITRNSFHLVH